MIKIHKKSDKMLILGFVLPALLIYVAFQIIPLMGALVFSVSKWNGLAVSPVKFVGLDNFKILMNDKNFLISLKNMIKMVVFSVAFHTPIALLLAVAINSKCRGHKLFKAIFFVPTIFPLTAVGLMWYFIFMPNGALNLFLKSVNLHQHVVPWLINESTAMNAIISVNIWVGVGFYMVILLAGLATIPDELYEAAQIDGANSIKQFFLITIPMLKPIIGICIVMDIIGSIKVFDLIFAMTEGGPNGLTNLPTTLLYYESFRYDNFGKGSAIGVLLLLLALSLVFLSNFLTGEKRRNK
ncbi:sugar ABC transporter permease [Cetobacterium somerae]|uniref:carbohydrate ABC transporter permease n=1 Tax=Cetobacterium sp. NK01 TaxID=2993530 RepID=UPI002117143E|nr:sugar ABC transporter permease [Cetobacterium sp. NK01]MCQ8212764.1 sugar ABC transporter permease [Cetobacterium sp. NK01]